MGERKTVWTTFKAKRWVVVTRTMAHEVAITTPNGKRLKAVTRAEILAHLRNPERCKVFPVAVSTRITPATAAEGGE